MASERDGVYVNTDALRDLAKDLVEVADGVGVEAPEALGAAAKGLAAVAASIASNYPSTGDGTGAADAVATSIRAEPVSRGEWRVRAGGPGIPLAGLWELGNEGSDPNAETFWHPVFGNQPSVPQSKWPYLRMALDQYEPEMVSRLSRIFDIVLRRFRL